MKISAIIGIILFLFACNENQEITPLSPLSEFEQISIDKYYSTDLLSPNNSEVYGIWKILEVELISITGHIKVIPNCEFLLLKPNTIFGVITDDELVETGKLKVISSDEQNLVFEFQSEVKGELCFTTQNDEIVIASLNNDTLYLTSPTVKSTLIRE
jgi:hypothetical protein